MALSSTTNRGFIEMTTIKLEIPNSDPVAMFHMGEALRNIAKENGYTVQDVPVLKVSDSDFKEWHERFITELATELQTPVNMLKGNPTNASEEDLKAFSDAVSDNYRDRSPFIEAMTNINQRDRSPFILRVLEKPAVRDALAEQAKKNGVSICMNPETSSSVDVELLSPHVTVVEYEPASDIVTTSDELIDADGLPHDKRIHSKGATRLNDDTWRMKKKPADKTDEEWAEFVDGVKAELKQLMDIPVATGEAGISVEDITQAEINVGNLTPPTLDELAVADSEQSIVNLRIDNIVLPPISEMPLADVNPFEANPVVTPPIVNSVTPPVVVPPVTTTPPTDSDVPNTFPLFMKWLTTNNKKLTSDMVNKVLNDNGVTAIPLLTSRVDLIPQIHAELVKLL